MPIQMQCPQCQAKAALPDNHAGRPVRCKRCKATFTIPPDAGANPDQPTVIDRYLVRELLGQGAFGCVYRAFDPRLERDVALKVLRPQMISSAQAVERFLREARSAAKLLHPNIVPVHDAGRSGSVYYIASAFIRGMTLASAIPEEGGMEPGRAVRLTAQLATALGYAHKQGILHRDVKPANAMLSEQESLHLMDFGLAGWTQEESTRLTRLGAVMGTPAYMAPEQASGDTKNVGPAADLYSAGVVLYELLTSRLPFEGGHPAAFVYLVVHTAPTPPSQHKPDLDAGLEAICLKAMAKKPEDRFASGEEMATALMGWTPPAMPSATPVAVAWPVNATASPVVQPKATVARRGSVFEKETVHPSSERPLAPPPATVVSRPSEFKREIGETVSLPGPASADNARGTNTIAAVRPVPGNPVRTAGPAWSAEAKLYWWSGMIVGAAALLAIGVAGFSTVSSALRRASIMRLRSPELVHLVAGETKHVEITLDRHGYQGSLTVEASSLPDGVTLSGSFAPGASVADLTVSASPDASEGSQPVRLRASNDDDHQEVVVSFRLEVEATFEPHLAQSIVLRPLPYSSSPPIVLEPPQLPAELLRELDSQPPLVLEPTPVSSHLRAEPPPEQSLFEALKNPFAGRTPGKLHDQLVKYEGGTDQSETAIARGLLWLALHQAPDGHWSLNEFNRFAHKDPNPASKTFKCTCTGESNLQNDIAATALGLLPFLAGGFTQRPNKDLKQIDYTKTVKAGLDYLIAKQAADGNFGGDTMYAHALATIAMCEAYGMTSDPMLKTPALKAIRYIEFCQDKAGGGWRYTPKSAGDTSVTGWAVMALKSGQIAGLELYKKEGDKEPQALRRAKAFLETVKGAKGGYNYIAGNPVTAPMTAVGMLCQQYLGVGPRNQGLINGVKILKDMPPGKDGNNIYYEYYATQAMHHMGGDNWEFWNLGPDGQGGIRDYLVNKQDKILDPVRPLPAKLAHQDGSWAPDGPGILSSGGRVMYTSLSLLTLEVYYRYPPLYWQEKRR